jgi:hypothetical protein
MSLSFNEFMRPLPDIALIGKRRAGKDSFYETLKLMGFDVKRVAFGDPLREKLFEMFPHLPKDPKPVREMIIFGQAMREIDPDIWVKLTIGRLKLDRAIMSQLTPASAVFTDVRQPNEFEACKKLGAVTVRIDTPENIRVERMLAHGEVVTRETLDAYTETALDRYETDFTLRNDGTIEDFQKEITELVYKIQTKRGN